jgi:hypothetical protein
VTDSMIPAAEAATDSDRVGVVSAAEPVVSEELARRLVEQARTEGLSLIGPGGLLGDLTKKVLETSLEVEMTDHLGYDRHAPEGRNRGNSRNGTRAKTVITEVGPVEIDVPRDRDASFEPVIVRKGQRRLEGIEPLVLSLSAKGLTLRGDLGPLRRRVRGQRLQRHHLADHRHRAGRDGPTGRAGRWIASTRCCSSTSSSSRSATAKSPTDRSTWWSASPWRGPGTSWACGSAKVVKAPNTGLAC